MKVTDEMVDRFLSWKLPEDFHPDAGITFNPEFNVEYNAKLGKPPQRHEPIGTNLLTATQARAMLEHVLSVAVSEIRDSEPKWPTKEEVSAYRDLFRIELDKNMNNHSGSPSTDAHQVALCAFVKARHAKR